MALKIIFFHLFTALVAVNLIFAEEESDRLFGLPFFGGNQSDGNQSLPFFGFFGNAQLPSFLNFESFGSRQERSVDNQEDEDSDQQDRLLFGSLVSCNYTTQGGTRCAGCRQSLACYPNNVGRLRTCSGFLRYCNNGRCSFIPGDACNSSGSSGSGSSGSGSSGSGSSGSGSSGSGSSGSGGSSNSTSTNSTSG